MQFGIACSATNKSPPTDITSTFKIAAVTRHSIKFLTDLINNIVDRMLFASIVMDCVLCDYEIDRVERHRDASILSGSHWFPENFREGFLLIMVPILSRVASVQ